MFGAIVGAIIGSVYEFHPWNGDKDAFPLFSAASGFTDDTVMTAAVAEALMDCGDDPDRFARLLVENFHSWGSAYPNAGYGGRFARWLCSGATEAYNSFGNGSAMRVSPVGWAFDSLEDTRKFAAISANATHNHPEGVKGAQATAEAIFLARKGAGKGEIKKRIIDTYGYSLDRSLAEIRPTYEFNETCQKTVPEAITAFLESGDFESAIRNAVWLRGDADTLAAITGSIAEAFYGGVPADLLENMNGRLDPALLELCRDWRNWLDKRQAF